MSRTSVFLRLSTYYAAQFGMVGVLLPFWPVWLESRGLSAVQIGILLAAMRWMTVATGPIVAHNADRLGERKRPLILCAAGVLGAYLLFPAADAYWHFLAIALLAAFFQAGIGPLSESLAIKSVAEHGIYYGRVRLWGSISFILVSSGLGAVLAGQGEGVIHAAVVCMMVLLLLTTFTMPGVRPPPSGLRPRAILDLLRHPVVTMFILAAGAVQGSHSMVYAFGTLHWRNAGIPDEVIGLLWAEGVVAEVVFFALGGALVDRLGPGRTLAICCLAGLLRWSLLALSTSLFVVVPAQLLHGLTFGATHYAAIRFIARGLPESLTATGQSLYMALSHGAAFALLTPLMGPIFERYGGGTYWLMAAMCGVGIVFSLRLIRLWDGTPIALAGRVNSPTP